MADCPKCTCPPTPFDPDLPLRETYAHNLRTEEQAILNILCAAVVELTRESDVICRRIETGWPHNLAAAAVDLRYLERWLAWEGAAEGDALERWQRRFADVAERIAPRVGELAGEIEAAIAASPSAE